MSKTRQVTIRLSADEAGALENLVRRQRRDVDQSMNASAVVRRLIVEEERAGMARASENDPFRDGREPATIRAGRLAADTWNAATLS